MAGDLRLVFGEGKNEGARRFVRPSDRFDQCQTHTRRWVVEQEGHRHFGGPALLGKHFGL
ncbi:hypothetical protein [Rhizobium yanglingense]